MFCSKYFVEFSVFHEDPQGYPSMYPIIMIMNTWIIKFCLHFRQQQFSFGTILALDFTMFATTNTIQVKKSIYLVLQLNVQSNVHVIIRLRFYVSIGNVTPNDSRLCGFTLNLENFADPYLT